MYVFLFSSDHGSMLVPFLARLYKFRAAKMLYNGMANGCRNRYLFFTSIVSRLWHSFACCTTVARISLMSAEMSHIFHQKRDPDTKKIQTMIKQHQPIVPFSVLISLSLTIISASKIKDSRYVVQRVSQCMLVWPTIYHVKMDGANNPHMNRNYRTSPYQDKLAYLACWPMRRERVPLVWRRSLRTPQPILPSAYCMPDNYSLTSRASSVIVIERP